LYSPSPVAESINGWEEMVSLVKDINEKRVDLLLFLGGNPVYDLPVDLDFSHAMDRVAFRGRLGLHEDETSNLCHWHVPQAHALESWNDVRAFDGTVTIAQPMIEALYAGKTPQEFMAIVLDGAAHSGHDLLKDFWKKESGAVLFDAFWQQSLHDGVVARTAYGTRKPSVLSGFASSNSATTEELEIVFKADPTIWDGRFANNGWLQELPKPVTKLTWDNAAHLSPAMARKLNVADGDMLSLSYKGNKLDIPALITPGHVDNSVTVHVGYGRAKAGRVGDAKGFNAYALRTSDLPFFGTGLAVSRKGGSYKLATTQTHHSMEGREIIRAATLADYKTNPKFAYKKTDWPGEEETLYDTAPKLDEETGWGMTIDMNACTGCNSCVIACQSENSISVVGKEQVGKGREMHWIRIDNYFEGSPDNPEMTHQPVPCMQCENAPCEPVCPVGATTHTGEGINQMVYNRCVGTRYCSNNCPYKVRRFNFFQYADETTEQYKLMRNPDVTVRMRGVMEKCNYCIQRIQEVKIDATKTGRKIKDGEIITACQSACPSRVITFGNIHDEKSRVAQLRTEPRHYALLGDLNVRPRTTYLAKVRNSNPEI
jgi:Fe-S-cluster-containing dehydrogenase component